MTEALKKNVLFITIDGASDFEAGTKQTGPNRLLFLSKISGWLKEKGLNSIIISPVKKYADIYRVPNFPKYPEQNQWFCFQWFILKELPKYIKDYEYTHVCIWYYDGYPINFDKWEDEFLAYDLVGYQLGSDGDEKYINGGFSLRSKRLIEKISEWITPEIFEDFAKEHGHYNEDMIIQSKDLGFRFAPKNINDMFSRNEINEESFGVHIDGKSFNEYIDMFLKNYDVLFKTLIELKK